MKLDKKIIKIAVIGCGHIGKRHAEMIARNKNCQLVALIDIKPKEKLHIEYDNVPFFSSLKSFFNQNIDVDIVTVATPNGLHAKHALTILSNNKHVIIEKPMTLFSKDAKEIITLAKKKKKQVFTVMQNRYSPPSIWIKDMVSSGTLGAIYSVHINSFWNRDERYYTKESWHGDKKLDGGTLFTQFSHFIDIMYWLFGDIKNINTIIKDFKHQKMTDFEDAGIVNFEFLNGGIGNFNFSTALFDKNMESSMTIIGENGTVKIGGQYMNEVVYCHVKDYKMPELLPTNPGNDYGTYKGSAQNHHYVYKNVVEVILNNKMKTTQPEEGFMVVDIIERIYASNN